MSVFRNLRITTTGVEMSSQFATQRSQARPTTAGIDRALTLAKNALELFAGAFPFEAQVLLLRTDIPLPWFGRYHGRVPHVADGIEPPLMTLDCREISDIVLNLRRHGRRWPSSQKGNWALLSADFATFNERGVVQISAIEAMVHVDSFLTYLFSGRGDEALVALSAAHDAYCYAVRDAVAILSDIAADSKFEESKDESSIH